jgi:hypothetical protein
MRLHDGAPRDKRKYYTVHECWSGTPKLTRQLYRRLRQDGLRAFTARHTIIGAAIAMQPHTWPPRRPAD